MDIVYTGGVPPKITCKLIAAKHIPKASTPETWKNAMQYLQVPHILHLQSSDQLRLQIGAGNFRGLEKFEILRCDADKISS